MTEIELSDVEAVLDRFIAEVTELLHPLAVWAHGSLALGDYQPGRSDLDLVAVLAEPLTAEQTAQLTALHKRLLRDEPAAAKLYCAYMPISEIADAEISHYNFAHARALRRPVSPVSRCELLCGGRVLHGASPAELLPRVSDAELATHIRHMLRTHYLAVVTWSPSTWFDDMWVDQVALAYARAAVTLRDGRLITKREALEELTQRGAPALLVADIRQRRYGEVRKAGLVWRTRRALTFRTYMRSAIRSLLAES
jgi:hypothetical protein